MPLPLPAAHPVPPGERSPAAAGRDGRVHAVLRSRTEAAHRRLDAAFDLARLPERGPYGAFLRASAAALIPLEARLDASEAASVLPDWPARRRGAALLADLAGLGEPCAPASPIGGLFDRDTLLGVLYVLEGSRLGGAMIRRAVLDGGDPAVCANLRYLDHGRRQRLWPSFLARLDRAAPDEAGLRRMTEGALAAFAAFERAAAESDAGSLAVRQG
ncbi:biliverdin-producing heme oxygenase [Methylobacterium oryzisoli]|uniref:biliverdin-producing heme oxygenase n=1 Tax=Methylobacterium oryzisoli TaxID=3385502 RepID=UPI0038918AAE